MQGKWQRSAGRGVAVAGLCIMYLFPTWSQLCTGDLGDNIFTDGNFGSGIPNVVQIDPLLAPGFTYTTNVPPDDGEYTLTNDMDQWPNLYPAWLPIGDNDVNPRGYMMVINASFQPGIFYQKTIDNLCEHTVYQVSADVINLIRSTTNGHILPNVSFLLNDIEVYTTGLIPQDEEWHTYGFTFATGVGETSAKLTLRNNAPGGIGNDLALDNISFQACGPDAGISLSPEGNVCEGSIFPTLTAHISADTGYLQWQISYDGFTWTDIPGETSRTHTVQQLSAGQYFFRYVYGNTTGALSNPKCRIVSLALLVEVIPVMHIIRDTLCEGLSFELNGEVYTETGIYLDTFMTATGCDSIVQLELEFVDDPMIEAGFGTKPTSCEGATDGAAFLVSLSDIRPPFFFTVNDSIIPPPSTSVNLPAGTYTVGIVTPYGCGDTEEVTIIDGPPLEIMTDPDTTIRLGHTILIESVVNLPVDTIYWLPFQGISCPYCLDTYATPTNDITYVIYAENDAGCIDADSITIRVDRTPVLYVPNVFTPNGDQVNDVFTLSTDPLSIKAIEQALIFDRWGGVIARMGYTLTDYTVRIWDGGTSDGPAMPGMYVYLIELILADGSHHSISGDVNVLR